MMTNETKTAIGAAMGVILLAFVVTTQGCDLRQTIEVKPPKDVMKALEIEGRVDLSQADAMWEDWTEYVENNTARLDSSIADAEKRYEVLHQFLSIGLEHAGTAANTIPYGGLIFGALTGVTGLMLPQPKFGRRKKLIEPPEEVK